MLLQKGISQRGWYLDLRKEFDTFDHDKKEEIASIIGVNVENLDRFLIRLKRGLQYYGCFNDKSPTYGRANSSIYADEFHGRFKELFKGEYRITPEKLIQCYKFFIKINIDMNYSEKRRDTFRTSIYYNELIKKYNVEVTKQIIVRSYNLLPSLILNVLVKELKLSFTTLIEKLLSENELRFQIIYEFCNLIGSYITGSKRNRSWKRITKDDNIYQEFYMWFVNEFTSSWLTSLSHLFLTEKYKTNRHIQID